VSITRQAIDKSRVTIAALLIVVAGGISAFATLPQDEDPGFTIRIALVQTYFPGASPERVEDLVTDPIEAAIQEIPELDFVASESRTGVSLVFVNVSERYTDMRPIWDALRRKVERVSADLPDGVIGPFVNDEFGDVFGVVLTITGDGYDDRQMQVVAEDARDELLRLSEVAKVDLYGVQEERIFVEYNNARLAELGLSPNTLSQILQGTNIVVPGGDIIVGLERIVLEPTGSFESVEQLRRTLVTIPGRTDVLFLEDVATVERGYIDPPELIMTSSGAPCVGVAISMREGGNNVVLGQQVAAEVNRLQAYYPHGIDFDVIAFQPDAVEKKVDEFVISLVQSVAIVLAVMLLFLGIRTGLVVSSLIPTAMIAALLVMGFLGIGLDQMSLASLIIALGMLVDNAIVMAESIMVSMREGKSRVEAAVGSAKELQVPLLTSSLTTSAAFLPIFLAESATGEYTAPLFKVVTITLLCSWLLAITMTPLLCVLFLKVKERSAKDSFNTRFYKGYRGFLTFCLRHRMLVGVVITAVFALSLAGLGRLPQIFFPPSDKAIFQAEIELSPGTTIAETEAVVREIERYVAENLMAERTVRTGYDAQGDLLREVTVEGDGVVNWGTYIGDGGPRFYLSYNQEMARPEFAFMLFNTTSVGAFETAIPELQRYVAETFPDVSANIRPLALGPPVSSPVAIRISGPDVDEVFELADRVAQQIRAIEGTRDVQHDWGPRTKRIIVEVDDDRARGSGITNYDVAISLQTALSGIESTQYREGSDIIPVTLRSVAADRADIGKLETLSVFSQATGGSVPLVQVADLELAWSPNKIIRRDRRVTVTVTANVGPGFTAAAVNAELRPWLADQSADWGLGYTYEVGGEAETAAKANQSIAEKLPIAALIIVLLLVTQFNSFRRAAIILMTIPLGLIGVVIGLTVARSYFGFMTLLGIISLSGIVINNAIVLIDRIKIEIEENGLDPRRAVIEAAQRRLRPILLTTCTTIGGLLPLWLGGGPMWEPMAISIIFGLLFATVLTLGVVPILYSLFFRLKYKGFAYES